MTGAHDTGRPSAAAGSGGAPVLAGAAQVAWTVAFGAAVFSGVLWALHGHPGSTDNDAFFHFAMAQRIAGGDLYPDIGWLPLTILGDAGTDHHWLWHVLVAPLTALGGDLDAVLAAQAAGVAGAAMALREVARRLGAPSPTAIAALAVFGGLPMVFRLAALRAQTLAICLIAAWLLAALRRRHVAAFVLALIFAESYHGAVILLPLAVVVFVAERVTTARWSLRVPAYTAAGLATGVIANPWFPNNIDYFLFHVLFKGTNQAELAVGREWLRATPSVMLAHAWPVTLALAVLLGLWLAARRRSTGPASDSRAPISTDTLALLGATLLMLTLYAASWRFVEYFVPMAALAAGVLWRDAATSLPALAPMRRAGLAPAALALVAAGLGLAEVRADETRYDPRDFRPIGEALARHAAPGDLVFNTAWADFPLLVWVAPEQRYVTGLDPSYLAFERPELGALWEGLRRAPADAELDPAPVIRDAFGACWAVVDLRSEGLAAALGRSPETRVVALSEGGALFRILSCPPANTPRR